MQQPLKYELFNGGDIDESMNAVRNIFRRGRTAFGAAPDPLDYEELSYTQRPIRRPMADPLDYEEPPIRGAGRSGLRTTLRRMGAEGIGLSQAIRGGAVTGEELVALLPTIVRFARFL